MRRSGWKDAGCNLDIFRGFGQRTLFTFLAQILELGLVLSSSVDVHAILRLDELDSLAG